MPQSQWKHLYNSKRWQKLRQQTFLRDGYICQVCKKPVSNNHNHSHAAVCDHIIKHEGCEEFFFDPDNLQTLGASCHNSHKQRLEKSGIIKKQIGADGWPVD